MMAARIVPKPPRTISETKQKTPTPTKRGFLPLEEDRLYQGNSSPTGSGLGILSAHNILSTVPSSSSDTETCCSESLLS